MTFGGSLSFFKRKSSLEMILPRSNSLIKYYSMALPTWYLPKKSNSLCQELGFYFTAQVGVAQWKDPRTLSHIRVCLSSDDLGKVLDLTAPESIIWKNGNTDFSCVGNCGFQ